MWPGLVLPGCTTLGTTRLRLPGYTTMYCTAALVTAALAHRELKSAMGSEMALRNSQNLLEVNLRETICLLAPLLVPCCKNQAVSKAQEYLHLSNPHQIPSRVGTLP